MWGFDWAGNLQLTPSDHTRGAMQPIKSIWFQLFKQNTHNTNDWWMKSEKRAKWNPILTLSNCTKSEKQGHVEAEQTAAKRPWCKISNQPNRLIGTLRLVKNTFTNGHCALMFHSERPTHDSRRCVLIWRASPPNSLTSVSTCRLSSKMQERPISFCPKRAWRTAAFPPRPVRLEVITTRSTGNPQYSTLCKRKFRFLSDLSIWLRTIKRSWLWRFSLTTL